MRILSRALFILLTVIALASGEKARAELPTVTAQFARSGTVVPPVYTLEVAANNTSRMTGLMYRNNIADDHGMIFVYPSEKKRTFWMKNTYVSLDLIFLDKSQRVQGIIEGATPLSTSPLSLDGEVQSRYVVELAAGIARKNGISKGDQLIAAEKLPNGDEGP